MEVIEQISVFFFDIEYAALNQKLCAEMMQKLKIEMRGMRRKKFKIYIRHSQKNLKHYDSFLEAYLKPS